ncbi:MAG TPA: TMEM175 family protein [Pyrinomonadaceae bacterium]
MESNEKESGLSFERVVFFSDAVFAIVITLLVLEIKVPHIEGHTEQGVLQGLFHLLPKFIGFVMSFFIVGVMWIEHHRIFRFIERYDTGLLLRNLTFLLSVSFVPFPTALFSEYYWSRTAFILYAATFGVVALTKLWVWNYAARRPALLGPSSDAATVRRISRRSLAVPIACAAAIALSFVSVFLAPLGFTLIPLVARALDPGARGGGELAEEAPST